MESKDVIWFVQSLKIAIQGGMVVIPSDIDRYKQVLYEAFDGDLKPLENQLLKIQSDIDKINATIDTRTPAIKWKAKMLAHYERSLNILQTHLSILKLYWDIINGELEKIRDTTLSGNHIRLSPPLCNERENLKPNSKLGKRIQI